MSDEVYTPSTGGNEYLRESWVKRVRVYHMLGLFPYRTGVAVSLTSIPGHCFPFAQRFGIKHRKVVIIVHIDRSSWG